MDPNSVISLHSGNRMPVMGLGSWQLTDDTAGSVETALKLGYRMIDTARDYGTQPGIGKALKRSGIDRSDIYLVTKVEENDDAYGCARRYVDQLQVDHADLILIHRPPPDSAGEDLWRGLIQAKRDGITRDIGVSNYSESQIDALVDATGETPVVNQIEWSPFGHSDEMLRYCDRRGIVIQAYSPLTRTARLDDTSLEDVAARHGKSPAQVLIRWNLQHGTVPLPKANQGTHQEQNLDVFDFEIASDDMRALDRLNEHYSALGELPYV